MALPVSPNAISLGQVNTELGISPSTTEISLNQAAVRTLFAKSSGAIAMSDGHGKSAQSAPVFPSGTMINFAGGSSSSVTNYSYNNRTMQYWNSLDMDVCNANACNASNTNTFPAATGGGITYEWQFLTVQRWVGACGSNTPFVGSAESWNGPYYNDSISGASSNSLTLTGYAYLGTAQYHGVAGYWRLKASNSLGETYTGWIQVSKVWGKYQDSYECNCTCPCNTTPCNCTGCCTGCCDENDENCTCDCSCNCSQCCEDCSVTCDTCYNDVYQYEDSGGSSGCGW